MHSLAGTIKGHALAGVLLLGLQTDFERAGRELTLNVAGLLLL
jgi:hypothetical protein